MKAYLTIGMPASGKSTWAKTQTNYLEINLDECRAKISGDEGDQSVNKQAIELRNQLINQAATQSKDIIISDTNLNPVFRQQLVEELRQLGFIVEFVLFPVGLDVAKSRNSNRSRIVPDHVLENMYSRFKSDSVENGYFVLNSTLIPYSLLPELNKLANLQLLYPSITQLSFSEVLNEANLIKIIQDSWIPGSKLKEFLIDKDLYSLDFSPFLKPNIEAIVSQHLDNLDTPEGIVSIITACFIDRVNPEVINEICLKLAQQNIVSYKNSISKTTEIIEETLKNFFK